MSTWQFDESAAQFPPPRSEEPANLRREIVDELRDHLTCARRREQLAGAEQTEEAVRRRVLERFGDPAAVARKLWLDWMWERIMTQRILVATCTLLAVISCVALGLAWASLNRQEDLIATWQSTSETQLRDQQKLFERLLAESQKAKAPSDWNPVELRFVKGKEDGPPADGINVNMSIEANETGIPPMSGVLNKEGIVRFERVRYGTYHLNVRNSANERFATAFTLQPGEGMTRTIVCPDPPTEPANVMGRIAWPDDLANRPFWFQFQPENVYRIVANERWRPPHIMRREDDASYPLHYNALVAPNGEIVPVGQDVFGWVEGRLRSERAKQEWVARFAVRPSSGRRGGTEHIPHPKMPQGIRWPGSDYRVDELQIFLPERPLTSIEDLNEDPPIEPDLRAYGRSPRMRVQAGRHYFYGFRLSVTDWSYRIERGTDDKPGTLWLTPTDEAVKTVRAALVEIDPAREAAEKARVEFEKKYRAEQEQQQQSADAPDGKDKAGEGDK